MGLKPPNSRFRSITYSLFRGKRLILASKFSLLVVFFALILEFRTRSIGKDLPKVTNLLHFSLTSSSLVP